MHRLPPPKTDTGVWLTEDGCGFANEQHFLTTVNAYFFASELGDTGWTEVTTDKRWSQKFFLKVFSSWKRASRVEKNLWDQGIYDANIAASAL